MSFLFPRRKLFFAGTRFFSRRREFALAGARAFRLNRRLIFEFRTTGTEFFDQKKTKKNPYYPMFPAIPVRGEIRSQIHHEHHD